MTPTSPQCKKVPMLIMDQCTTDTMCTLIQTLVKLKPESARLEVSNLDFTEPAVLIALLVSTAQLQVWTKFKTMLAMLDTTALEEPLFLIQRTLSAILLSTQTACKPDTCVQRDISASKELLIQWLANSDST